VEGSYDEVVYCSVCEKELSRTQKTIEKKTQHAYGEWNETLAPTCDEKGSERRDCNICDHFETRAINANGHKVLYSDGIYSCQKCTFTSTGSVGLEYTVNDGNISCTITGIGTCTDTEVYIPSVIDGYTVTIIGEKAFADCAKLICINIPETVEIIRTRAFYGCSGLMEITIPKSVTSIGTQIFYKASNLSTVYYNSTYSSSDNPDGSNPS
jgi:hypothetical protein